MSEDSSRIRFQNIYEDVDPSMRKTKVIVPLAPQQWTDANDIVQLLDAGMNVARLDFKTGDQKVGNVCSVTALFLARSNTPRP